MMRLYSTPTLLPTGSNVLRIESPDIYFNAYVLPERLNEPKLLQYIAEIDSAKIVDFTLGTIQTAFGTTGVEKFSSGLKTLLIVCLHMLSGDTRVLSIDLDECGKNVISLVFREMRNSNIVGFTENTNLPQNLEYPIQINDMIANDCAELANGIRTGVRGVYHA